MHSNTNRNRNNYDDSIVAVARNHVLVLLMCGLPGSGKSSLLRAWKHQQQLVQQQQQLHHQQQQNQDPMSHAHIVHRFSHMYYDSLHVLEYDKLQEELHAELLASTASLPETEATLTSTASNGNTVANDGVSHSSKERWEISNSITDTNNATDTQTQLPAPQQQHHQHQQQGPTHAQDDYDPYRMAWRQSRIAALQSLEQHLRGYYCPSQQQRQPDHHHQQQQQNRSLHILVMDDNFYLRSMRKHVYQVCQNVVTTEASAAVAVSADDIAPVADTGNRVQPNYPDTAAICAADTCCVFFAIIWMDTPLDVCLQRNDPSNNKHMDNITDENNHHYQDDTHRNSSTTTSPNHRCRRRPVPPEVIVRMNERFEPPLEQKQQSENQQQQQKSTSIDVSNCHSRTRKQQQPHCSSWEQPILHLDGRQSIDENLHRLHQFVNMLFTFDANHATTGSTATTTATTTTMQIMAQVWPRTNNAMVMSMEHERVAKERIKTAASMIHQLDQQLRHAIQTVARIRPAMASVANQLRQQVLRQAKQQHQRQQQQQHQLRQSTEAFTASQELNLSSSLQDWVHVFWHQLWLEMPSMEPWTTDELDRLQQLQHTETPCPKH